MEKAVQVADVKFPKDEGYRLYWIFDHSSCHTAYAYNSLNTSKINAKRGGCQPLMHGSSSASDQSETFCLAHYMAYLEMTVALTGFEW